MKAIRYLATLVAVAILFATFGAGRASAQDFVEGRFRLPFPARWGSANLAPGRYSFKIEGSGASRLVVLSGRAKEGGDPTYRLMGVVGDRPSSTHQNALLCQRSGSVCIVRTLELGVADETLSFLVPKSALMETGKHGRKKPALRAGAVQTVPIAISGK